MSLTSGSAPVLRWRLATVAGPAHENGPASVDLDLTERDELHILFSRKKAAALQFNSDSAPAGSSAEAPICVTVTKDAEASARHAALVLRKSPSGAGGAPSITATIQDLGSMNGTVVASSLAAYEARQFTAVLRGAQKGQPSSVHVLAPLTSLLCVGVSLFQLEPCKATAEAALPLLSHPLPQGGKAVAAPPPSSGRRAGAGVQPQRAARAAPPPTASSCLALDDTDEEIEALEVVGMSPAAGQTSSSSVGRKRGKAAPSEPSAGGGVGVEETLLSDGERGGAAAARPKAKAARPAAEQPVVCLDVEGIVGGGGGADTEREEVAIAAPRKTRGKGAQATVVATSHSDQATTPATAAAGTVAGKKRGRPLGSTNSKPSGAAVVQDHGPPCDACGTSLLVAEALAAASILNCAPAASPSSSSSSVPPFDADAALACVDAALAALEAAREQLVKVASAQRKQSQGSAGVDAFASLLEGARAQGAAAQRSKRGRTASAPGSHPKGRGSAKGAAAATSEAAPAAPKLTKQERLEALARIQAAAAPAGWLSLEAPVRARKRRKLNDASAAAAASAAGSLGPSEFRWQDGSTVTPGELLALLFPRAEHEPASGSRRSSTAAGIASNGGDSDDAGEAADARLPASRLEARYSGRAARAPPAAASDTTAAAGARDDDHAAAPSRPRTLWDMTAVPAAAAAVLAAPRQAAGPAPQAAGEPVPASPPRPGQAAAVSGGDKPAAALVRMLSPSSVYLPVAFPSQAPAPSQPDVFDAGIFPGAELRAPRGLPQPVAVVAAGGDGLSFAPGAADAAGPSGSEVEGAELTQLTMSLPSMSQEDL